MSYVVQQLQNCLISWFFNWINMVSVKFLGRTTVVDALFNHSFRVIVESIIALMTTSWSSRDCQGVALRKLHLHMNSKYFNWMVFVISIFQVLAESRRNKHESAWPYYFSTVMGILISQDSLRSFYFMLHVPSQAMKFRAWLAKFCCLNPRFLARNIKLAHTCSFISNLHWGIVDN